MQNVKARASLVIELEDALFLLIGKKLGKLNKKGKGVFMCSNE